MERKSIYPLERITGDFTQMKTYSEVSKEFYTVYSEVHDMSLDYLIDECSYLLTFYDSPITEKILANYFRTGELSKDEVGLVKAFYALAYSKDTWRV